MRHAKTLLAAALAALAAPVSGADPAAWLLQVSDAARQSNYQGVVVYRDARMMEVLRVVHRQKGGRVQERLTSLTGRPRDILLEGDRVSCAVGDQPVEATAGLPRALFPVMSAQTLIEAAQHYRFRDLGEARVAGRACHGVVMEPRDEFGAERPAGRMFSGFSHMGAMNAYGRAVGAFHVTVVGEVPQSTVRLIGDGFEPAAPGGGK